MYTGFTRQPLDDRYNIFIGQLDPVLLPDSDGFEALWALHPSFHHTIMMHGRSVPIPRWQQAYGADYQFSGGLSEAEPTPPLLQPFLAWAREAIDSRRNGLLLNWYAGRLKDYIGPHRDSPIGLIEGAPIVTISLGEVRTFRLRPYRQKGFTDFTMMSGTTIVIPADTNRAWTHEVPKFARETERRVSLTVRAFSRGVLPA